MKTILLILSISFLHLYAAPSNNAVVATHTLSTASGIYFDNSTMTMTPIAPGTTPLDFTQDIFAFTTRNKLLQAMLVSAAPLVDGFGNSIPFTVSYTSIASGTTSTVLDSTWIMIVANGEPSYRDGVQSPGYLTISTGAISPTQVAGSYSTGPMAVDVKIDGVASTAIGYLTINVNVEEFTVIGFVDTSVYTSGVMFVGNDIDFGLIAPATTPTPITRDVYVHTNKDSDIQITFSNTPPLLSSVDGTSTIPVTYSYTLNSMTADVVAGTPFIASNGINDGTVSVGSITFTPDAVSDTQTSGAYIATVNVVVAAM